MEAAEAAREELTAGIFLDSTGGINWSRSCTGTAAKRSAGGLVKGAELETGGGLGARTALGIGALKCPGSLDWGCMFQSESSVVELIGAM